jgi:transcription-repair coupling factor (superfamily II helicase)
VALLSRFKSPQEQKETKRALAEGTVGRDRGTHALLSKDVKFKDLGLLIMTRNSASRRAQEQIKTLKTNVDVLTLTATPIPRTLHMSMIGIRDMSVIDTRRRPLPRADLCAGIFRYAAL